MGGWGEGGDEASCRVMVNRLLSSGCWDHDSLVFALDLLGNEGLPHPLDLRQ